MLISGEIIAALIGLFATILSVILTYAFTKNKTQKNMTACREKYIDDTLKEIIEMYQNDVKQLREEVKKLTEENVRLREEILDLKDQLLNRTP